MLMYVERGALLYLDSFKAYFIKEYSYYSFSAIVFLIKGLRQTILTVYYKFLFEWRIPNGWSFNSNDWCKCRFSSPRWNFTKKLNQFVGPIPYEGFILSHCDLELIKITWDIELWLSYRNNSYFNFSCIDKYLLFDFD